MDARYEVKDRIVHIASGEGVLCEKDIKDTATGVAREVWTEGLPIPSLEGMTICDACVGAYVASNRPHPVP
jgi:hypothetical protein